MVLMEVRGFMMYLLIKPSSGYERGGTVGYLYLFGVFAFLALMRHSSRANVFFLLLYPLVGSK